MRWIVFVACLLVSDIANAKTYRLRVALADGSIGRASAVCIGETEDGFSLFATAKHNFEGAVSAEIVSANWTARTKEVVRHATKDCAVFSIVRGGCEATDLDEAAQSETAYIDGFGPEYHSANKSENCPFTGTVEADHVAGHDGLHPITGDSGGPVVVRRKSGYRIVGVVSGYSPSGREFLKSRYTYRERRLQTIYTPTRHIRECLQQRWQYGGCPPGGCPIYVRPQVQQPMIGIGIPTGPPRVIGVAEPVPQTYVPRQLPSVSQDAIRQAVAEYLDQNADRFQGPRGESGANGRSVSKQDAAEIIGQWLDANRDQLQGPPGKDGKPGERGLIGVPSEKELAAVIDLWIQRNDPRIRDFVREVIREEIGDQEETDVDARLTALEQRKLRILLVDGKRNTVIDDETYEAGKPVMLDVNKLRGNPETSVVKE